MKKWMALLTALVMTVLCAAATAEEKTETAAVNQEALKLFSSEWADGFASIKVYAEEDYWRVYIVNESGSTEWEYSCRFDEAEQALISRDEEANVKTEISIDEEGSEIDRKDVYSDGKARFSLNGEGKLIWKDEKEDAGAAYAFEKIGWFQGVWIAGEDIDSRWELYCYWDVDEPTEAETYSGYKVEIERYEGEAYTHWTYGCNYDPENNTLTSFTGTKEFAEKEGEPISTVYDDGKAKFFMDDEGCVRWTDENENAGEGLQFSMTNG